MTNRRSSSTPERRSAPERRADVVSPFALHREALAATLRRSEAFAVVDQHAEPSSGDHDVTIVDLPALGMPIVRDVVRQRPTVAWGGYLHTRAVAELVDLGCVVTCR